MRSLLDIISSILQGQHSFQASRALGRAEEPYRLSD